MITIDQITLGILAGGRALRLHGADKSELQLEGETLLQRTLRAFPENYGARLLSYNRVAFSASSAELIGANLRVVPDHRPDFPGPMAALEALVATCSTPWLLTVPVDCRDIPASIATTLIDRANRDGTVLRDADGLQPLLALWRVEALCPLVAEAFENGEMAVHRLIPRLEMAVHDISPRRLGNLNTPADFSVP